MFHSHTTHPCVLFQHSPGARSAASIVLRGANDFMVDEMERTLHDALCVVKRVLESNLVVPGGGAVGRPYLSTWRTLLHPLYVN